MITEAFIRDLPKTDLHVHLDGSLRIPSLIEMAKQYKVELPSYTEEGLRELVFKDGYADLNEYLHGFKYTCGVLRDPEALERVSYELAWDNINEGVRYMEVRFAPMLSVNENMNLEDVLTAVDKGMRRAKREFNDRLLHENSNEPPFEYGLITCAMRFFTGGFSPYYQKISEAHQYMPQRQLYGLASLELARAVIAIRDQTGLPIVGFDLAGAEYGYPAEDHQEAFDYVHQHFMKKTVHAGEAYGPESIFQAITKLHADRIGHGYHLLNEDYIKHPGIEDRAAYVRNLCQYIADSRLTIEVCLSSNMDTDPNLASIADHPFRQMKELKLSTTLCTDNRLISHTNVTRELKLAVDHFGLSNRDLKSIIVYGFKRGFFPRDYRQKRIFVRRIINYYHEMEKKHKIDVAPVNEY
ncbi:adenosine deaminase family protein [Acanthopleuribacter pedis]|uniref:adenosine deaminase n=1 Tax=Acanthopleuribacter pedis TaxID=442870 RepID=A0A8J7U2A6_9BACT|nr:adenosine deaminase family protein [Acanthopleuribacter pedis]MBO1317068.1 adenosine deaminase family protein [Acanthopleuribacter pedis]